MLGVLLWLLGNILKCERHVLRGGENNDWLYEILAIATFIAYRIFPWRFCPDATSAILGIKGEVMAVVNVAFACCIS